MPGPAINGASADPRPTTRHRAAAALDVLRLPQALWIAILLAVAGGVWTWYQESQEAEKRAAVLETRAESDRSAWRAKAEQLARDLEGVRASLRERIDDRGAAQAEALGRLSNDLTAVAQKLDRCAELLSRSTPEINGLKLLPARVRGLEQRVAVLEARAATAGPPK